MLQMQKTEPVVSATLPNLSGVEDLSDHFLKVANEWKLELFQHIDVYDEETGITYLSPKRYMVLKCGVVRLSQMWDTKISFPEDNKHFDELTGQVTGPSKGSKISFPEMNNLLAEGETYPILETIKIRGGDAAANRQFEYDIATTGIGNIDKAMEAGSGVKSTKSLATLLRTIHIDTTLDKKG